MSTEPICPCEVVVHPRILENPPGLDVIRYRVGDYDTFRAALLRALPGEQAIAGWHPAPKGDLALQLVEWWAYLADILTFYNERIANGAYLRTVYLPGGAASLVRMLGYRPRPGIGATGVLGAVVNAKTAITVPAGFAVQSKPGPGELPQIFEVDEAVTAAPKHAVDADAKADTLIAGAKSLLFKGTITSVQPDDVVAIVKKGSNAAAIALYLTATVASVVKEKDPRGDTNTRISFTAPLGLVASAKATDYRVLTSDQETRLFTLDPPSGGVVLDATTAHLASLSRGIVVNDLVLFQTPTKAVLARVSDYKEEIWTVSLPGTDPAQSAPVFHTKLTVATNGNPDLTTFNNTKTSVRVRFALRDVGEVIDTPPAQITGTAVTLLPAGAVPFPATSPGSDVLIEDALGQGAKGTVVTAAPAQLQISFPADANVSLTPPLRVLYDLLPVSRGKTVSREILGSGDASVAGQTFTLKKSPLTYLQGSADGFTENYRSTLRVLVDGIAWTEVPSFYGRGPNARVFVTREDVENKTHVSFGDGINGARVPTGTDNVVASYRFGSGRSAPATGSLSIILKPYPGLQSVRNPVRVGGGDDPDPPALLKRYAPRSILCFGRAVAGDDFEAIAAEAPSVTRARSYFEWDAVQQRAAVKVYVGDDPAAVISARAALDAAVDPNRLVKVAQAIEKPCSLTMTLLVDPRRDPEAVASAARSALLDPETGLFSAKVMRVGAALYDSQIYEACLRVPGAVAVHNFLLETPSPDTTEERHSPGEGGFFTLAEDALVITTEVAANVD